MSGGRDGEPATGLRVLDNEIALQQRRKVFFLQSRYKLRLCEKILTQELSVSACCVCGCGALILRRSGTLYQLILLEGEAGGRGRVRVLHCCFPFCLIPQTNEVGSALFFPHVSPEIPLLPAPSKKANISPRLSTTRGVTRVGSGRQGNQVVCGRGTEWMDNWFPVVCVVGLDGGWRRSKAVDVATKP